MLTARQKSIFEYILDFRRRHGCSPSIPELQKAFDIRSPNGVAGHLKALEAKGLIRRARRGSRQIDIAGPLESVKSPCYDLPLFGGAPAGRPGFYEETHPEGCVTLDERSLGFRPKDGCFVLRVRGDSMKDAGILDGDLVVVEPAPTARSGQLVVALVNGESMLKHYVRVTGRSRPVIQGVIRTVIRKLG
jgi:repressor LexA